MLSAPMKVARKGRRLPADTNVMMSTRRWIAAIVIGWLLTPAVAAWAAAAGEGGQGVDNAGVQYVELGPPFVTNYDGGGRLKYLKTRVSVRVQAAGAEAVRRHLPYLRNQLVMLFSRQLEENLTSTRGKEQLQREALQAVREALTGLEGALVAGAVINVYFPEYVIQS